MAEFQKVMKQAKRMCDANCEKCPLGNVVGNICLVAVTGNNDEVAEIECVVMDWAAKHPEPRYPTWTEWLREFSRAGIDLHKPIPADIAEKLGIKPIGGADDENA